MKFPYQRNLKVPARNTSHVEKPRRWLVFVTKRSGGLLSKYVAESAR